jgi:peptide/nickel transport system permease protein
MTSPAESASRGGASAAEPRSSTRARLRRARLAARAFLRNSTAMLGFFLVLTLVLVALGANILVTHSPTWGGNLRTERLLPPSSEFWFGTDGEARDIYSRVVFGSRTTLTIIVLVSAIAMPIGLLVGTVAGYLGGWVEVVLMRLTDVALAYPKLILALAFVSALGPGIENAIVAIAITSWPPYARLSRAETLTIGGSDYVAAAKLQGASPLRIILRYVMPLCMPSMIVRVTLDMAGIVITAAGLSFLGLGAQPPAPEWGSMIASGQRFLIDKWWVATIPGMAICLVSLGFNLLGDGLRDVLDPKMDR